MNSKKGLTIIEVLIATVVIAAAFSVLSYLGSSLKSFQTAQQETQVASFAKTYLDLLRSTWSSDEGYTQTLLPFQKPPQGNSYTVTVVDSQSKHVISSYSYNSSSFPSPISNKAQMRDVHISISNNRGLDVSLLTQVTRPRLR